MREAGERENRNTEDERSPAPTPQLNLCQEGRAKGLARYPGKQWPVPAGGGQQQFRGRTQTHRDRGRIGKAEEEGKRWP